MEPSGQVAKTGIFRLEKESLRKGWKNPARHEEGKLGAIINDLLIQELGDMKYNGQFQKAVSTQHMDSLSQSEVNTKSNTG